MSRSGIRRCWLEVDTVIVALSTREGRLVVDNFAFNIGRYRSGTSRTLSIASADCSIQQEMLSGQRGQSSESSSGMTGQRTNSTCQTQVHTVSTFYALGLPDLLEWESKSQTDPVLSLAPELAMLLESRYGLDQQAA